MRLFFAFIVSLVLAASIPVFAAPEATPAPSATVAPVDTENPSAGVKPAPPGAPGAVTIPKPTPLTPGGVEPFPEYPTRPPALLIHYIGYFLNRIPFLSLLIVLTVLDVMGGSVVAVTQRRLSSTISWKGMGRKTYAFLLVFGAAALEPLIQFPLAKLVAGFYCYTEAISMLEIGAALGAPLPPGLKLALVKLRDAERFPAPTPVQSAPQSVVINTRAVSVRPAAGQTQRIELPGGSEPDASAALDRNTAAVQANTDALGGGNLSAPAS